MRDYPDDNFPAFRKAAAWLREAGFYVFNPAENSIPQGYDLRYCMITDLAQVASSDCLFMLEGWQDSEGANLEYNVAESLGITRYDLATGGKLELVGNEGDHKLIALTFDHLEEALEDGRPDTMDPQCSGEPENCAMCDLVEEQMRVIDQQVDRHPNSRRFHELLAEAGATHDRKQSDYGRDDDPFANVRASIDWNVPGWIGGMIRLTDKVRRLQSLARKGVLKNESAFDSLMDIAVYALICYVLLEQDEGTMS